MVHVPQIARLEQQKELLAAKSEAHRVILALQLHRMQKTTLRAAQVAAWVQTFYPVLLLGALASGFLITRKRITLRTLATNLVLLTGLARRVKPLWRVLWRHWLRH